MAPTDFVSLVHVSACTVAKLLPEHNDTSEAKTSHIKPVPLVVVAVQAVGRPLPLPLPPQRHAAVLGVVPSV